MTARIALHELLAETTQRRPEQPFFIRRGTTTTYGELETASASFAAGLHELGIGKGDRVALVLDNIIEYPVAYYGILRSGAAVVPLCPDTRTSTLGYALGNCEAAAVVIEGRNTPLLEGQSATLPSLRVVISHGKPELADQGSFRVVEYTAVAGSGLRYDAGANGEDLASIIFTSGTTAHPKGVMLAHRNLIANTRSIVEYLGLTPEDRIGMVLPFFYSYGNSILHTHVCVGGTICIVGTVAFPAAVLTGIQRERCTGLSGVPSTFARLLQSTILEKHDLTCLRYITQAGGPMTPALTQKLRQAIPGVKIFVMYGQTEGCARLSYLPPAQLDRKLGSIGIGIPGVTLRIMDKEGKEVPRGTIGEIVANGANIMLGYWKKPEETARALRPEGLRTGDLGWMDEDGFIFIAGRESDMIKSGAHRIGPKEIEDVVEKLDEVNQCAVVGVPDELLGEAIVAFVVPVGGKTVTPQQVLKQCHDHLPRFKMPGHVRVVDNLPKTDTGKLKRNQLKEWFAAGIGLCEHHPPSPAVE